MLQEETGAVLLSCDALTIPLGKTFKDMNFHTMLGIVQSFLKDKAAEIAVNGLPVILDWGFWSTEERRQISAFCYTRSVDPVWHYISVNTQDWEEKIHSRNNAVISGATKEYYIDKNILKKVESVFNTPSPEEIDIWVENRHS